MQGSLKGGQANMYSRIFSRGAIFMVNWKPTKQSTLYDVHIITLACLCVSESLCMKINAAEHQSMTQNNIGPLQYFPLCSVIPITHTCSTLHSFFRPSSSDYSIYTARNVLYSPRKQRTFHKQRRSAKRRGSHKTRPHSIPYSFHET